MSITREQAIEILKNGLWMDSYEKAFYVSFGQLPPEVQVVARGIGRSNFEFYICEGTFWKCCGKEFVDSETVKLRQDYIDPPKVKV